MNAAKLSLAALQKSLAAAAPFVPSVALIAALSPSAAALAFPVPATALNPVAAVPHPVPSAVVVTVMSSFDTPAITTFHLPVIVIIPVFSMSIVSSVAPAVKSTASPLA
ncbi:MAG: hypothetical protein IJ667_12930 [Synergistaceae bacterium]|nr:hypothetical protein [Synergistaceae bacterium]